MNIPAIIDDLPSTLQPALTALEAERRRVIGLTLNTAIIVAVVVLVLCLVVTLKARDNPVLMPMLMFPVIIGIGIVALVYSSNANSYRHRFKAQVIERIIHSVDANLRYIPDDGISEGEFRSSQLFRAPDRYRKEDLVMGQVGATQLRVSEVHAEYQTRDSKNRTQWHTIFRGLFLVADFNKDFAGVTMVLPDSAQRLFGKLGQSMQALGAKLSFDKRELVKLEDPEFEKCFVVYSTDQIEARYILSPSLMRRLLDFRQKVGSGIRIAFITNHIFLAIPLNKNLFEPPMFNAALSVESIAQYVTELQFVLDIIEDLDLNTRIWSKQNQSNLGHFHSVTGSMQP